MAHASPRDINPAASRQRTTTTGKWTFGAGNLWPVAHRVQAIPYCERDAPPARETGSAAPRENPPRPASIRTMGR
jgi:hypothetical protein